MLGKNQVPERYRFCIANVIISFVFFFLCSTHCLALPTRHMGIAGEYVFSWAISLRLRLSLFQCPLWLAFRIELVSCPCLLNANASLCGKLCRLYARVVSEGAADVSRAHKWHVDVLTRVGDQKQTHHGINTALRLTADSWIITVIYQTVLTKQVPLPNQI